jgi:CDP-diacylglycerol--glycerol-3-phosphate 3-phosphatidyltransferase
MYKAEGKVTSCSLMSLAHYFTLFRIVISPVFPVVYLKYEWLGIPFWVLPYFLLFLLGLCESSDLIDGFIARRRNQVTDLGKVLDPMADSMMHISLFLAFTQGPTQLPLMLVLIFFYRDFFITTLRTLCALRGVALAARVSGKIKTVIQACTVLLIVLLLIPYSLGMISQPFLQKACFVATSIAALYTAASAADYLWANRRYLKRAIH